MSIEQFGKAFSDHLEDLSDQEPDRKHLTVMNVAGEDIQFYEPTGGQVWAMSLLASSEGVAEMARDIGNLLIGLTDEDGAAHIKRALVHRSEPLPPEVLSKIVVRLVEIYTARPSEPQPASSPSGPTGGTSSTANSRRAGKAGSSNSRRPVSAT